MQQGRDSDPLVFESAVKRFGAATALDGLTLAVHPGEIFGFLGPNGAGKTTAIHLAMGFLRPTRGGGTLFGAPFTKATRERGRVGYVPDAPAHFPGHALESVLFAARLNGQSGAAVRAHSLALLSELELPAAGTDVRRFSRGQQQRLALAQALVTRPDLLILDEPTSALDPNGVAVIRAVLGRLRDEGVAIFFSSHQLQEVERLCDRAAFLDRGRLLCAGTMRELLAEGESTRITLRGLAPGHPFLLTHAEWKGTSPANGDSIFSVSLSQQRRFLEEAWAAGAELVSVKREHRTLDALFDGHRSHGESGWPQ